MENTQWWTFVNLVTCKFQKPERKLLSQKKVIYISLKKLGS